MQSIESCHPRSLAAILFTDIDTIWLLYVYYPPHFIIADPNPCCLTYNATTLMVLKQDFNFLVPYCSPFFTKMIPRKKHFIIQTFLLLDEVLVVGFLSLSDSYENSCERKDELKKKEDVKKGSLITCRRNCMQRL